MYTSEEVFAGRSFHLSEKQVMGELKEHGIAFELREGTVYGWDVDMWEPIPNTSHGLLRWLGY